MEDYHNSIDKIRSVVRYVRSSPARFQKFKECVVCLKIPLKKLLCLDVTTTWNSTYLMLESAENFEKAFKLLEHEDAQYFHEFCVNGKHGAPSSSDWDNARFFIKFLKVFYDATLKFLELYV